MPTNKLAILILGPEGSGTKLLAECFCRLGFYGDFTHQQRLDTLDFTAATDRLVFRRSVPHHGEWPDIGQLVHLLTMAGYAVQPLVTLRDRECCARSQVASNYVGNLMQAKQAITAAIQHVFQGLAAVGLYPQVVVYEPFVASATVRQVFFAGLGLVAPQLTFYDANAKYGAV